MDGARMSEDEAEERVAHVMRLALAALCHEGIKPELVLAAAHAEVVAALASTFGGEAAAGCMRRAAERIEGLPAAADAALALARPMGRA